MHVCARVLATLQVRDNKHVGTPKPDLVSECLHKFYCGRFRNLKLGECLRKRLVSFSVKLTFM